MARRKTWPESVAERRGWKAWLWRDRKAWSEGVTERRSTKTCFLNRGRESLRRFAWIRDRPSPRRVPSGRARPQTGTQWARLSTSWEASRNRTSRGGLPFLPLPRGVGIELVAPSPKSLFTDCGDWSVGCAVFDGVRGWHGRPAPLDRWRLCVGRDLHHVTLVRNLPWLLLVSFSKTRSTVLIVSFFTNVVARLWYEWEEH